MTGEIQDAARTLYVAVEGSQKIRRDRGVIVFGCGVDDWLNAPAGNSKRSMLPAWKPRPG